jgi:uncharacterized membrane protein YtjA (UPF0391 family)
MLGWSIGFFLAALVAAVFGFGGIASAFAGIAQLLFWVFLALLALSIVFSLFSGRAPLAHDGAHPVSRGTPTGALMLVAAVGVGILAYAWMDNDWSAEQAGRAVDRTASQITAEAGEALEDAGDRAETFVETTSDEIRTDTANGLDEASERVEETDNSN